MATFTFANSKMTIASTAVTENVISTRLRSYKFASGEYEIAFKNLLTTELNFALMFAMQDVYNGYKVVLEDNVAGASRVTLYSVVAGAHTKLSQSAIVAYTRGNKVWMRVLYDRIAGTISVFVRDNAGTYQTTPLITAYTNIWTYGYTGLELDATGMGSISAEVSDFVVRAQSRIGDTNVPVTESGYYFRDEFTADSMGRITTRYRGADTTIAVTGGKLVCTNQATDSARTDTVIWLQSALTGSVVIEADIAVSDVTSSSTVVQLGLATPCVTNGVGNGYLIRLYPSASLFVIVKADTVGSTTTLVSTTKTILANTTYHIKLTWNSATGALAGYFDGEASPSLTVTDTTYTQPMYPSARAGLYNASMTMSFDNLTVSGTRVYNKPMLRGAQRGEYWDGTAAVPCVRYTDDFNWDTIGEYTGDRSVFVWTPMIGAVTCTAMQLRYLTVSNLRAGTGRYTFTFTPVEVGTDGYCRVGMFFGQQAYGTLGNLGNCYMLYCVKGTSSICRLYRIDAGTPTIIQSITGPLFTLGARTTMSVVWNATAGTFDVYQDGVYVATVTGDTTYGPGYFGVTHNPLGAMACTTAIHELQVDALGVQSTNGLAVALGGVAHGGLYDTETWVGLKWAKEVYAYARDYACSVKMGLSTLAATAYTLYFKDYTRNTAIQASGSVKQYDTTAAATYETYNVPTIELTSANDGDQILIGLDRTPTATMPPIYVTEINLTKLATPNTTYETPPTEIASVNDESAALIETIGSVVESTHSEILAAAELYVSVYEQLVNETVSATETAPTELGAEYTESVDGVETDATELADNITESMSAIETLESLYEMSIDELMTLVEGVSAAYNHYIVYVELVCNFGYNTTSYLAAPQIVTSPVFQHDVGVRIRVYTNNTTLPTTGTLSLIIRKPYGAVPLEVYPVVDYTTGVLTYESVAGDLDQHGKYKVQVHGVFDDGDDQRSDVATFIVYAR